MITGPFNVSKAFAAGWKLTKQHWLVMVGLMLGLTIISLLLSLFQGTDFTSARYWIITIISLAISLVFNAGYLKMYLVAADGEEPEFNLFGKCAKRALPLFFVSILFSLGTLIGLALLIIPGFWFISRFSFASAALIDDENCSVIEAFRRSYEMTKGKTWPVIGMYALCILVMLAGFIALIVGIFFANVVVYFTYIAAYRMLYNPSQEETVIIEETAQPLS